MDFNLEFDCMADVIATNADKPLFRRGSVYKGRELGEHTQLKDEYGCIQTFYDNKILKKHFKVLKKGDSE
jgi:hypothetical protein